jgi:hypothetical protein
MDPSKLPKSVSSFTPTVNFSPNDQLFTQNDEKIAKVFDFDENIKPEKGILSKPKTMTRRVDSVVNEVFIDKRPKLKRQESIISGFEIEGIEEEDELPVTPTPASFDNPTFINMDDH